MRRQPPKAEMRAESEAAVQAFLASGGKITHLPASRRAFSGRELDLMERGEKRALENLQRQRAEEREERERRREQRG